MRHTLKPGQQTSHSCFTTVLAKVCLQDLGCLHPCFEMSLLDSAGEKWRQMRQMRQVYNNSDYSEILGNL